MDKKKIAILYGGDSMEREASILTCDDLVEAIDPGLYEIDKYDTKTELENFFISSFTKRYSLVIPIVYGQSGEDGKLQGMLELLKQNYLFSGTLASALSMNKFNTKIIAKNSGISVPRDIIISPKNVITTKEIITRLNIPLVVKPFELGSDFGISVVHTKEELQSAMDKAFSLGVSLVVEEFVRGREFTVGVIGTSSPRALPVIEIVPKIVVGRNFQSKYDKENFDALCPATISEDMKVIMQKIAVDIFNDLGCRDLARIDFIWSGDTNMVYFLDINTLPGLTKNSLVAKSASVDGLGYKYFVNKLINDRIQANEIKVNNV